MKRIPILVASALFLVASILGAATYRMPIVMRPFSTLKGPFQETRKDGEYNEIVITEGRYFGYSGQFHLQRTYHVDGGGELSEFWVFVYSEETPLKIHAWKFEGINPQPDSYLGEWDNPPRKLVMAQTGGAIFKQGQPRIVEIILPTQKGDFPKFIHNSETKE